MVVGCPAANVATKTLELLELENRAKRINVWVSCCTIMPSSCEPCDWKAIPKSNFASTPKSTLAVACISRGAVVVFVHNSWLTPPGTAITALVPFIVKVASARGFTKVHTLAFSVVEWKSSDFGPAEPPQELVTKVLSAVLELLALPSTEVIL